MKKDRWFNPFWQLWLKHLMSRPSCYSCPFTTKERCADITLGDLWGVHLYCPELYGNNLGASLIIANTTNGKKYVKKAENNMYGHELMYDEALKYQGPLRKSIDSNIERNEFINDLKNETMNYQNIIDKWYKKPSLKLLFSKYIWGNRQKVFIWSIFNRKKVKK